MTSCLLLLVVLFLIGLGLGDSPLVILSLCSLVLSFVLSFSACLFLFLFSLLCLMFFSHEVAFWIYIFLTYQKKKKNFPLLNSYLWSHNTPNVLLHFIHLAFIPWVTFSSNLYIFMNYWSKISKALSLYISWPSKRKHKKGTNGLY